MNALTQKFYEGFSRRDFTAMNTLYRDDAEFSDPIFGKLTSKQVRAMWHMLLSTSDDLRLSFQVLDENAESGRVQWVADYSYPGPFGTRRHVHNVTSAAFVISDGKILRHEDSFDFGKWISMALGLPQLLTHNELVKGFVRRKARERLDRFIKKHREYQ
jgi:ketosteroid isomerase-like protein